MSLLTTAQQLHARPSNLLEIEDGYTAYCFDEACSLILAKIKDEKTPHFTEDVHENKALQMLLG
jgi:hypothetical protein